MKVTHAKLSNLRNHRLSDFILDDEVIFVGRNGVGKSSVLEALYFLLCFRGFKQQPLSLLVTFDEDFLRLEADIERLDGHHRYVLKYKDKREISVDDEVIDKLSDYLYKNIVAVNTPDYMGILSQLQPDRRAFIDRFIFYTDRSYIDIIKRYNRLISQKALELANDSCDRVYIDILNEKIVDVAKLIYDKRFYFISQINERLGRFYSGALGGLSSLSDNCIGEGCSIDGIDSNFILYESNVGRYDLFDKEILKKRVSYGVHRDRIYMSKGEGVIEKFSSFGQKKTFSLLVLLAFIEEIESARGERALVMLDDFEAGLDIERAKVLREPFSSGRQVLYTGVDAVRINYKKVINLDIK